MACVKSAIVPTEPGFPQTFHLWLLLKTLDQTWLVIIGIQSLTLTKLPSSAVAVAVAPA